LRRYIVILNNEPEFGVTVHFMNVKFDDGPIINQEIISIDKGDDLFSLYPKAFKVGADLLVRAINDIKDDLVSTRSNGPEGKSYFSYPSLIQIYKYRRLVFNNKFL